jgi:hypothetical protein
LAVTAFRSYLAPNCWRAVFIASICPIGVQDEQVVGCYVESSFLEFCLVKDAALNLYECPVDWQYVCPGINLYECPVKRLYIDPGKKLYEWLIRAERKYAILTVEVCLGE